MSCRSMAEIRDVAVVLEMIVTRHRTNGAVITTQNNYAKPLLPAEADPL